MKFEFGSIGNKVSEFMGMTGLKIKEASPEILLGGGIILMGGAVITGIFAARKHDQIVAEHEEELEEAKCSYILPEEAIDPETNEIKTEEGSVHIEVNLQKISDKEVARKVRHVYCRTAAKMCKLYAPTALLMALSTACFIGMHNIQGSRILGLSGALGGLREAYDAYQNRNIELNGEESHQMCKYGWHEEEIEDENGEKKKVRVLNTASDVANKIYEKNGINKDSEDSIDMKKMPFHDQFHVFGKYTSHEWIGQPNLDLMKLKAAEEIARDFVESKGWCVVNDVLDCLGIERTPEGMYEGWVKGRGEKVRIGWDDPINNLALSGHAGEEWILDMNVHGNVYQILEEIRYEKELKKQKLKAKLKEEVGA